MAFDRRRLPRLLVLTALTLYLALLGATPLLHHDFDCHLKSPAHCPACLASPVGFRSESLPSLGATLLVRGETLDRSTSCGLERPIFAPLPGRSPPF